MLKVTQQPSKIKKNSAVWHPCSQMSDYQTFPPLEIASAQGAYLTLKDGQKVIDIISSWWTKPLGHGHPHIKAALEKQLDAFEHVMLANTTSEVVENLAERLAHLAAPLNKVFFASDGCCAVEIAMKMSLHARYIQGQSKKTHFMALQNSYHGETMGALAASDCQLYREAYESALMPVKFLQHVPYVQGENDPLWQDCHTIWPQIQAQLDEAAPTLTAILVEPILQAAGGMKLYSQDFLKRLSAWAKANDVHLICDEIASGLGRLGKPLAYQHAGITPDFVCLSKALTGGFLPMSVTLTSQSIYDILYDHPIARSFLHSNTFAGNPLAAACAVAALQTLDDQDYFQKAHHMQVALKHGMEKVASATGALHRIRSLGAMVAADLTDEACASHKRCAWAIYQEATREGLLLRPVGQTLYWFPPFNISNPLLDVVADKTTQAVKKVLDAC